MRARSKVAAILLAGCIVAATPATTHAAVALPPTTVTPKGDYFSLSLPPGETIREKVSGTETTCAAASRPKLPLGTNPKNQIPTSDNPSNGPVVIPITRLNMTHCTNSTPGVFLDVENTGGWQLLLRHKDSGDVASLLIPKNGSIISGFIAGPDVFCMAIVAPNGPVVVRGKWTNGNPSTFKVTDAAVPTAALGAVPCPQGSVTGSISVTFNVINVSNPGSPITVS